MPLMLEEGSRETRRYVSIQTGCVAMGVGKGGAGVMSGRRERRGRCLSPAALRICTRNRRLCLLPRLHSNGRAEKKAKIFDESKTIGKQAGDYSPVWSGAETVKKKCPSGRRPQGTCARPTSSVSVSRRWRFGGPGGRQSAWAV